MSTALKNAIMNIVIAHMAGDYTETLTKYSYLDQGAFDFISFTQNPAYQGYMREIEILINMNVGNSYQQILDLGPGNGMKGLALIQAMSNQLHKYIALDISTQMLNIARQHQETISYVQRCYIQEDFDDFTRFHTHRDRKSLFMMLGNTITNLVDMQNYLNIFFAMFHKEDMFLVGVEIRDNENVHSLVEEYNTPENRRLTFRPLEYIGVPQTAGYVNILFNPQKRRIEERFIFGKEIYLDNFHVPIDARVLLSVTNKPTLEEFISDIQTSGFIIQQICNNHQQYIFAVSK